MEDLDFYTSVVKRGNDILVRGVRNGEDVRFRVHYEPTLYVEHANDYGYRNVYGQNLKPISFDNMYEATKFAGEHKDSNLTLYGFPHFHNQYILENLSDSIDKFDKTKVRVWNIDIEVTSDEGFPDAASAAYPITALCVYDNIEDTFYTFGIGEWISSQSILPEDIVDKVEYFECESEFDLMSKFVRLWQKFTPNIVTGWNIEFFDIPYIHNRLANIGMDPRKLSPWNHTSVREVQTVRGTEQRCSILGVDVIDYMDRYRKTFVRDSYRLDNIANTELGERKSLSSVAMLDMGRVPFTDRPSNVVYELSDDEEFNRFAKVRKERVDTLNSNNPNKDIEIELILKEEKKAAFQAFISYNIQDVNLVKRLDEKLGLLDVQMMVAYTTLSNFEEVNGTVRVWDCLINKELWKEGMIPPYHIHPPEFNQGIPGGHVKEPQVGKHGWCMSFDLNSLYPHLIMQFNISPETILASGRVWETVSDEERIERMLHRHKLPESVPENTSISGSGTLYSNDKEGIIPKIMRSLYEERKTTKKKMLQAQRDKSSDYSSLHLKQYAIKILLNSGYGALTNKFYRWYDRRMGESTTLSGQLVIRSAEKAINKWMNRVLGTEKKDYIIAIDTDSNYVNMQPLVDKFFKNKTKDEIVDLLDKIAVEQVQKVLEEEFEDLKNYLHAFDQKMVMEREAIASSAFWTAKKRYAMCVWDMEGVRFDDKPKLKIQGLEAIRSSTPAACREPLLNLIEKVLLTDEENVQQYIAEFKDIFMKLDVSEISMPRTMNNLKKYDSGTRDFKKGTPPHVRGALVFNRLLKKHGLDELWESIKESEKAKFCYLTEPNSIGTDVISFNTAIPAEFDLERYIDRHKMFEKIIIDPVTGILDPIGWSVEKKLTLESFFY